MLCLDHLTVIAPTLADGVAHVRECLGIAVPYGGVHPEMGTHNHVLRLGDGVYLEIIAVDPNAPAPNGPRWFGLDDQAAVRRRWSNGERLRGWVARTDDIDGVLAGHAAWFGGKILIGGRAHFSLLPDGGLPLDGVLPSVIDRAGLPPRADRLEDNGVRLVDFVLEHPSPDEISALYRDLGVSDPPVLREGSKIRYVATIETADGQRTLS